MITIITVVAILIFINALYVAAEFSAVAVRRTQIEELARSGNVFARLLQPVVADSRRLDVYIAACQIGITASSLFLGAYGQSTIGLRLAGVLEQSSQISPQLVAPVAILVTLFGLISLQVIMGELVPKSVAIRYPATMALATVIPLRWSIAFFAPFIWLLNGSSNVLLRVLRVPREIRRPTHVPEEIDFLVEESHEGGMLDDAERERVHNVLRLAGKRVREVMIPRTRVFAVDISTPVSDLLDIATDSAYTRIPVYDGDLDNVVGLLHVKDLLAASSRNDSKFDLRSVLREMPRVLSTKPVTQLLSDMKAKHIQMSLVVDEYGGTSGIVTLEDLLEEVVGDIPDEYTKAGDDIIEDLSEGHFRVPGSLPLSEVNEKLGTSFIYPGADTLTGLIMGLLGRMPEVGDRMETDGWKLVVEILDGHTVASVLLNRKLDEDEKGDESNF